MRESNFKNIALNKAAVSITTNLYDRRALDSTMDQPLVNSLNHLTFLTSSSAKVRETLTNDGGLERLVSILHECYKDEYMMTDTSRSLENEKLNALIAWKWTLAFQCLVLVATRGTERIRKRVVEAGVLPIISTVLDNYLLFVRNFDNEIDDYLNEKFLTIVANKLHKMKYQTSSSSSITNLPKLETDDSKDYDYFNICNYISSDCKLFRCLHDYLHSKDARMNLDDPLEVNEMIIKQNMHSINETITCPRSFLNGKIIPKDDDVVWSLQLLAFTSKYSNLKCFFQYTHLVESLSLRVLLEGDEEEELEGDIRADMNSEMIKDFKTDNDEMNEDYDMIYMDPHRFNQKSSQQSSQPQLTQSSFQSFTASQESQQPYLQPSTQQFIQSSQITGITPLIQTLSQQYSQQATSPTTKSSLTVNNLLKGEINNENMVPSLNDNLTKTQSSSTSTSSSLYGNSLLDDESLNVSTLPSTICEVQPELSFNKVFNDDMMLQERKVSIIQNPSSNENINAGLIDSIVKLDNCLTNSSTKRTDENTLSSLIEVCEKLNNYYEKSLTCHKIRSINESKLATRSHMNKYNYETYFTSKNNHDDDLKRLSSSSNNCSFEFSSLFKYKINLFPLVEKFTMKTINTADMCYWAGVVMRNSCRKDEQRGGVRQCAYHGCGKWEASPRQFAKCRRCKRTKYCSKDCQLKAWSYHKHWCIDSTSASSATTTTANTTAVPSSAVGAPTPDTGDITANLGTATSDVLTESAMVNNENEDFINRIDGGGVSEEN